MMRTNTHGDGTEHPLDFDVTIVGAGVVGSAIARELSRFDLSVALLDSANDVGQGTSKANTAILHTGFDSKPGTLEARLVRRGYELLGEYAEQAGIPVERIGAVLVAWDEEQRATLPRLAEQARQNGYPACELIDAGTVYEQIPHLGPGVTGGLTVPGESIICPWTTTLAYATEAVRNATSLLLERKVTTVEPGPSRTVIHTSGGAVSTRWLINAAGLGADEVDRLLGHERFTVTPRRGELLVFDKLARPLVPKIVLPVPSRLGKGVLVSPTVYGNVMLGPTAEDLDDKTDTGTSEAGFAFLSERGTRLVPRLFDEEVTAAYAGLRASIAHGDYLIECEPAQRYVLVGGIRSTGLTASLAIAEHVATMLCDAGLELSPKEDAGAPPRMANIGEAAPRPYERFDLITADHAYGEVVCYCERVTAGEIRDALSGTVPARDRSGVSKRTRATNGRCQGFYCGARVQAQIDQTIGTTS